MGKRKHIKRLTEITSQSALSLFCNKQTVDQQQHRHDDPDNNILFICISFPLCDYSENDRRDRDRQKTQKDSDIMENLGADSLDVVELVMVS